MASEKSSAKKTLSMIGNILIWLFLVFAVVVTIFAFVANNDPDGIPSIGGKYILNVRSDSMKPVYNKGDLIIGTKLTAVEKTQLQVGEIITFQSGKDVNRDGRPDDLETHRIMEIVYDADGKVDGYYTAGDNNKSVDGELLWDTDPETGKLLVVEWQKVLCKNSAKGFKLPFMGTVINFLNTPKGFLFCIIIPLALFFVLELISFIRKFLQIKNEGKKTITAADEEAIKQRAVEEFLKQQAAADGEAKTEAKPEEPKADEGAAEEAKAEEAAPAEEAKAEEAAPAEEAKAEEAAPAEEAKPEEAAPAEEAKPEEAAPAEEVPAEASEDKSDAEKKTEE